MKITHEEFCEAMSIGGGDISESHAHRMAQHMKARHIIEQSVKDGEISPALGEVLEWLLYDKRNR